MLTFYLVSLFPQALESYLTVSVLGRAIKERRVAVKFYNPRDFVSSKKERVDDRPYGGGAGMVLRAEPILKVVEGLGLRRKKRSKQSLQEVRRSILDMVVKRLEREDNDDLAILMVI